MAEPAPRRDGIVVNELPPRHEIASEYLADEARVLAGLIGRAMQTVEEKRRIDESARRLVHAARAGRRQFGGVDAFLSEYGLSTEEGVILMCLAEALLRIPDAATADDLIDDKIKDGDWARHLGASDSLFVNASTWGLMLTGHVIGLKDASASGAVGALKRLVGKSGEPVIRQAMKQAMRIMGDQFVLGRSIREALKRAKPEEGKGYRYSYDMLGEAARTAKDAERYFDRYMAAIGEIGKAAGPLRRMTQPALMERPGLSVKLSAIHPRFEPFKIERVRAELVPDLVEIARATKAAGLTLTVDAEEADRLDLTLQVFGEALSDASLAGWHGFGIAVQAYGKRALPVLRWLKRLSAATGRRLPVRLVKGAYWDSEIKWAQERGLPDYPVFTRKANTDVSYLACGRYLLAEPDAFYPQFATHNAHTVAAIHAFGASTEYEFQRLHGMGEALYTEVVGTGKLGRACRVYAPVGEHEDLLAYLVRRLLENGANTSFVNRLADDELPVAEIIQDPVERAEAAASKSHPGIAKPPELFAPSRRNSLGLPLTEAVVSAPLIAEMRMALAVPLVVGAIVDGALIAGEQPQSVLSPHDRSQRVGTVSEPSAADIARAIAVADRNQPAWDRLGGDARAAILDRAAELMEADRARLMAVMVREAGKTLPNALSDLREAVDFLRYYASEARRHFEGASELKGATGERNLLSLHGRGTFAAISPWNFPCAIFTGQVAAALAAGNAVLAKPAEQTPITAFLTVLALHKAGVPGGVLQFLPGGGGSVGARIVADRAVDGVVFTGSNETARLIQQTLARREGPITPLIAETGGINAMVVDSSALTEQVVRDALTSAFDSSGQRCSALRVLFLQEDIAERTLDMLTGAMRELVIGDPFELSTDIGPVIDEPAEEMLLAHKLKIRREGRLILDLELPLACRAGTYVSPAVYEIDSISALDREVFGPILHVVRYRREHLDKVCAAIGATGYGLTLGVHSRIDDTAAFIAERVNVGNLYVNRNQIGAVVGVQPFGGEGLSGTGPKAGGPHYLPRFAIERVRTTDITASGGNTQLLSLEAPTGGE